MHVFPMCKYRHVVIIAALRADSLSSKREGKSAKTCFQSWLGAIQSYVP